MSIGRGTTAGVRITPVVENGVTKVDLTALVSSGAAPANLECDRLKSWKNQRKVGTYAATTEHPVMLNDVSEPSLTGATIRLVGVTPNSIPNCCS